MARGKSVSKSKNDNEVQKKNCSKCQKLRRLEDYFMSWNPLHSDSRLPVCKQCIKDMIDEKYSVESVRNVLRMIDRPFLADKWETAKEESTRRNRELFGMYMKLLGMNECKTMTWADSDNENKKSKLQDNQFKEIERHEDEFIIDDELMEKWGFGYSQDEYKFFEKKYAQLKNNYQEKTAMHREALLTYIRYRVKEELATARGDVKDAKEWGQLAAKAAQDAKINPSQMSKSDLSDGLDTFGQLVRTVEQAVDIIPILPRFKERPQDKVDFTIWCYINYIRDLKGLPLCAFNEIYQFYEERKKEYEARNKDEEMDDV